MTNFTYVEVKMLQIYRWISCACLIAASALSFVGQLHAKPVNYGGSNHFLYATGTADGFNTGNLWYQPALNIRPIVGTYQLNPGLVQSQMAAARASGQTVYVLPIWTGSLAACETSACNDGVIDGVWGEVVNYELGGLNSQHQNNLKSVLSYANQQGFERTIVRFNHNESGQCWPAWDEAKYQKIWNYVFNTHNLVTAHLQSLGSAMEVLYDIGGELGGIVTFYDPVLRPTCPQNAQGQQFNTRLWNDYVFSFTNSDTIGFSIAYDGVVGPARFTSQRSWYGGTLPKWWAVDFYPGTAAATAAAQMTAGLNALVQAMGPLRNQPVIIQETYFNDANVSAGIQAAISGDRLLNIDQVSQWPTTYGASHFSSSIVSTLTNSSAVFSNYLPLIGLRPVRYSSTNANILAVADGNCSAGASLPCSVTLVLGSPPSGTVNAVYVTVPGASPVLVGCPGAGDVSIPWIGQYSSYTFKVYQTSVCVSSQPASQPTATSTLRL